MTAETDAIRSRLDYHERDLGLSTIEIECAELRRLLDRIDALRPTLHGGVRVVIHLSENGIFLSGMKGHGSDMAEIKGLDAVKFTDPDEMLDRLAAYRAKMGGPWRRRAEAGDEGG
ncbi:MAG TPA: hypothetical protein VJP78_05715 [Thermoleophilia bacterium]|nr:hypothetical protein [Thermoleophilia bacterium]